MKPIRKERTRGERRKIYIYIFWDSLLFLNFSFLFGFHSVVQKTIQSERERKREPSRVSFLFFPVLVSFFGPHYNQQNSKKVCTAKSVYDITIIRAKWRKKLSLSKNLHICYIIVVCVWDIYHVWDWFLFLHWDAIFVGGKGDIYIIYISPFLLIHSEPSDVLILYDEHLYLSAYISCVGTSFLNAGLFFTM